MKFFLLLSIAACLAACTPGNTLTVTTDKDGNLIITGSGGVVVPTNDK